MVFGPYSWLILVILALSFGIQAYLKNTYGRWSRVRNSRDLTGAELARRMLDRNGLQAVRLEAVEGQLSDHYDPRGKVVRLSEGNYAQPSVASLAVAAHEVGHAIQDGNHMAALALRGQLAVPLSLGMNLAPWLFLGGVLLNISGLLWVGVIAFGAALLFHLVTLPVEFDASRRGLAYLQDSGLLSPQELGGARAVLTAAALTYVAGFAMALAQFLNVLGVANQRRN